MRIACPLGTALLLPFDRRFNQSRTGSLPPVVRKKDERKAVGEDIAYVQFKWPIGKPRVDHLRSAVLEVRTNFGTRIARTLFAVDGAQMILLHGFTEPEMAKKMGTSGSQLDRILDPENV
jgi:hypothetical protein